MTQSEESRAAFLKIAGTMSASHGETEDMYNYLETYAREHHLVQTLAALPFARSCHQGQLRSGRTRTEYLVHPMTVAVHALALGFTEDALVAAALLHDVCEDCGVEPSQLPVGEEAALAVKCLTREASPVRFTPEGKERYYGAIAKNPIAAVVKLLDRCHNVSSMIEGFSRKKAAGYVQDTEQYVYDLFEAVYAFYPERMGQLLLIRYHMDSVLTAVKHELKRREKG